MNAARQIKATHRVPESPCRKSTPVTTYTKLLKIKHAQASMATGPRLKAMILEVIVGLPFFDTNYTMPNAYTTALLSDAYYAGGNTGDFSLSLHYLKRVKTGH